MKNIKLKPGEFAYCEEPSIVSTEVDSSVVVCIWDKKRNIGGICSYNKPVNPDKEKFSNEYGNNAILNLVKLFKYNGSEKDDLVSKIIGGGLNKESNVDANHQFGSENTKTALRLLDKFDISVTGNSTGGDKAKKVQFNSSTGKVRFNPVVSDTELQIVKPKKILIVDDSAAVRTLLKKMISSDPFFVVMGEARDPIEAMDIIAKEKPDAITLDIHMPRMDGITFLKQYMPKSPIPTIMISAANEGSSSKTLEALSHGAFHYIEKPSYTNVGEITDELCSILKAAIQDGIKNPHPYQPPSIIRMSDGLNEYRSANSLVAIGASTGGTEAIREILMRLPADIPPIVIVLHIPTGYSKTYAERMNNLCPFSVCEAVAGTKLRKNTVYFAPGGKHMRVKKVAEELVIQITDDPPVNRFKPSVDYLFESILKIEDKKIVGVILTGMGNDGAKGLLNLKRNNCHTIIQNEKTCAVYGMPHAAANLGAANQTLGIQNIAAAIITHLK
jgi:two-component system, chemotaxis family, protein-glutamate methylesterase/glutaminase